MADNIKLVDLEQLTYYNSKIKEHIKSENNNKQDKVVIPYTVSGNTITLTAVNANLLYNTIKVGNGVVMHNLTYATSYSNDITVGYDSNNNLVVTWHETNGNAVDSTKLVEYVVIFEANTTTDVTGSWKYVDKYIAKLNTTNTDSQAVNASEELGGTDNAPVINLHKISKTGDYNDLNNKPNTLPNPEALTVGSKSYTGSSKVTIDKSDLGLSNVNNTSDADKPISTATQTALDNITSSVNTLDTNTVKKTGQDNQIISGNITIQGNFTVSGTTTTLGTETLLVKDNLVVTNSDGKTLADLSGLSIKINGDDVFGILYDPADSTVKLGKGTLDSEGKFTFTLDEGFAVATRDDSSNLTDGNLIAWNGSKFILTDSGTNVKSLRNADNLDSGTVPIARLPKATILEPGIVTLGTTGGAARYGNKADVGLSDVDNTSDMDKPISTATQSALDKKANTADLAIVATSGKYSDLKDTPTIPSALPNPESLIFGEKTYNGLKSETITKNDLGLGNVDNTSDGTKKTNFTGSIALGDTGFVTGGNVYTELTKKVDVVDGKGLSTNDLTDDLKSNYDVAYTNNHTHTNKELLDTYNQTNNDLTDAVNQKHSHDNKTVLDTITSDKVSSWDAKQNKLTFDESPKLNSTNPVYSNGIKEALDELNDKISGITGGGVVVGVKGANETDYRDGKVEITADNIGLGNVENKSVADIQTELTGTIENGNNKFVTGDAVNTAISGFITNTVTDLVNYYTKTDIDTTVSDLESKISAIPKFAIDVVTTLPNSNISDTTIYLLKTGEASQNLYTEYIHVNDAWEELGTQSVDLTGYATQDWVNTQIQDFLTQTAIDNLITTKLVGYVKNSELATIATSGKLSDGIEDATHKLVTESEKAAWNTKQDALTFDETPTIDSANPVTSGGVKAALDNIKQTEILRTSITVDDIVNGDGIVELNFSSEQCDKALNPDIDCKIVIEVTDLGIYECLRIVIDTASISGSTIARFKTDNLGQTNTNYETIFVIIGKDSDNNYTQFFNTTSYNYKPEITAKDVGLGNVANVLQYSAENKVPLDSGVTGVLPIANGGTGDSDPVKGLGQLIKQGTLTTSSLRDTWYILLANLNADSSPLPYKIEVQTFKSLLDTSTPYVAYTNTIGWETISESSDSIISGMSDLGLYCCKIPKATHGKGDFPIVQTFESYSTSSDTADRLCGAEVCILNGTVYIVSNSKNITRVFIK